MQAKRLQAEVASVSVRSRSGGSQLPSVGQRHTQEQQSQRQPVATGAELAAAAATEQAYDEDGTVAPDWLVTAKRKRKSTEE